MEQISQVKNRLFVAARSKNVLFAVNIAVIHPELRIKWAASEPQRLMDGFFH